MYFSQNWKIPHVKAEGNIDLPKEELILLGYLV